jgi:hypothetical protein
MTKNIWVDKETQDRKKETNKLQNDKLTTVNIYDLAEVFEIRALLPSSIITYSKFYVINEGLSNDTSLKNLKLNNSQSLGRRNTDQSKYRQLPKRQPTTAFIFLNVCCSISIQSRRCFSATIQWIAYWY